MDGHIRIRIPQNIRSILIEWGSAWDPALIPIGNHDRQRLSDQYRELGQFHGPAWVPRHTLQTIYFNARMNSRFGLVAEVRREGKTVVEWVEGVMARDRLLAVLVERPARSRRTLQSQAAAG